MAKIVPVSDIGIPVPSTAPPSTDSIACYFGPKGFTPDYGQANRAVVALSALSVTQIGTPPVAYYDFPVSAVLPQTLPDGDYDFYFTLVEGQSEGDFSPVVTESVDRTPPFTLGQPIVLG